MHSSRITGTQTRQVGSFGLRFRWPLMTNTKSKKPYNIHFVCLGNVYRSRLAAAYFDTLVDDRFAVTSSGVATREADAKTFSPLAKPTAKKYGLRHELSRHKVQTTNKLLNDADVIIFMNKDIYDEAHKEFDFDTRKAQVWHVPNFNYTETHHLLAQNDDQALIDAVEPTFQRIKRLCSQLQNYLTHTAWVDVMDAHNEPTGLRLPMAWVTDRGLWHRGIHVVAQTIDGKYIVEKRSKHIVFAPGMLEISLGGGVDSGEHPLRAATRETHEELGVKVPEHQFRPLFIYKQIGYHPHYKKQTRAHLYVYSVKLPVHSKDLLPQFDEVAEIRALTGRQVRRLLISHRMKHFGRLKWGYQLYRKAVAYSTLPL
jgi:protein-tyrosine-phosphatase/8-oxo-dGTP pyrophosphatase MutT (NUDIX family)